MIKTATFSATAACFCLAGSAVAFQEQVPSTPKNSPSPQPTRQTKSAPKVSSEAPPAKTARTYKVPADVVSYINRVSASMRSIVDTQMKIGKLFDQVGADHRLFDDAQWRENAKDAIQELGTKGCALEAVKDVPVSCKSYQSVVTEIGEHFADSAVDLAAGIDTKNEARGSKGIDEMQLAADLVSNDLHKEALKLSTKYEVKNAKAK